MFQFADFNLMLVLACLRHFGIGIDVSDLHSCENSLFADYNAEKDAWGNV